MRRTSTVILCELDISEQLSLSAAVVVLLGELKIGPSTGP